MSARTCQAAVGRHGLTHGVTIGTELLGAHRPPVMAGPRLGADMVHTTLRRHHGAVSADEELRRIRDLCAAPLLVEPFSADDLPAVRDYADGVVVGGDWMQDYRLLTAVGGVGLPVVMHRGAHCTVDEWLAAVDCLSLAGADNVVLCESGGRRHDAQPPSPDLALVQAVRERCGLPIVVDVGAAPQLVGAAVAAGADGVWLAEDAAASDVAAARETVTLLTPIARAVPGGSLPACRDAIDRVDALLATLLEYRAGLVAEVQGYKPVGGHAGRDPSREAQIVRAMVSRAPSLGHDRLATIMEAVIAAGLDAAEQNPQPPVWRM